MLTPTTLIRRLSGLVFIVGSINSQAATLEPVSERYLSERWDNGELIERRPSQEGAPREALPSPQPSARRAVADIGVSATIEEDNCPGSGGCVREDITELIETRLIKPDPGESNGDPVSYCATWTGTIAASADSNAAAAGAAGGGAPTASASLNKPGNPPALPG